MNIVVTVPSDQLPRVRAAAMAWFALPDNATNAEVLERVRQEFRRVLREMVIAHESQQADNIST